jgi:hypothetical protein
MFLSKPPKIKRRFYYPRIVISNASYKFFPKIIYPTFSNTFVSILFWKKLSLPFIQSVAKYNSLLKLSTLSTAKKLTGASCASSNIYLIFH